MVTSACCMAAIALLGYAALHDLAARTVPNWLPLTLAGLGLGLRLADHALLAGVAVAAGTFVLLMGVWLLGAMGGGDVKLWAAAALLVPPPLPREVVFFLSVLIGGGLLAALYLALGLAVRRPAAARPAGRPAGRLARVLRVEAWRINRRAPLPYACAIAAGAMLTLLPFVEVR